jgi:hypothetical protein
MSSTDLLVIKNNSTSKVPQLVMIDPATHSPTKVFCPPDMECSRTITKGNVQTQYTSGYQIIDRTATSASRFCVRFKKYLPLRIRRRRIVIVVA